MAPEGVQTRPHLDRDQTGLGPLYRLYQTSRGWICIAAVKDGQWLALARALGFDSLVDDPRFATGEARQRNAAALAGLLEPIFATRTAQEWFETLDREGVPCEVSSETYGQEFFDDPDAIANEWVVKYQYQYQHYSLGAFEQYGRLFSLSDTPGKIWGPPPVPGEHSRDILRELGYRDDQVDALLDKGVTTSPS